MRIDKAHTSIQLLPALLMMMAMTTGCVQFKPATFYDGVEMIQVSERPANISLLVEPVIYRESTTDVWGLESNNCQDGSLTAEVSHSGNQAIKLSWNRNAPGCVWAGIGIGWDKYAGKDLSEVMDHAAIQFHVRTQSGKMFGLPFVLTLEDYSGGMGFCYTSNKYFERNAIDEKWQKVIVPLKDFDLDTENLDVTNIKQLQIELQQSGAVYLDDIELIYYTPEPQQAWMEEEVLPSPIALPIQIFDDAFINNNFWGLITDQCQKVEITDSEHSEGAKSIYAKWDNTVGNCHLNSFGVSWHKWNPVDVTPIIKEALIVFDIKMGPSMESNKLSMDVGLEDYDRAQSTVTLQTAYAVSGAYSAQWTRVRLPLSQLPQKIDFKNIKHLVFNLEGVGEVYIDNIRLEQK
jgi:hypothetical protein